MRLKVITLALLAGGFALAGCATPKAEGYIQLSGWKLPKGRVGGYNFYMSEGRGHKFEKVNLEPVIGKTIEIGNLASGKTYYFRMTQVSKADPKRESKPGKVWSRAARPRIDDSKQ